MEDDEQEELRCTGSDIEIEEYSDTEEPPFVGYQSLEKPFDTDSPNWKKFSFIFTLCTVIVSVSILVISFPLYLESVSAVSNGYSALLFTAFGSVCILAIVYFVKEKISPSPIPIPSSTRISIPRNVILKISLLYATSGILIGLSLDQNRVLCHLQDPIKGIVLVFSLIYYFFFCHKMMSLQRIFSSTTIIVGLFISVDYGLCDEFRCRGREISGHTMSMRGSWGIRAVWTFVYVLALAAFTMFFTILERLFTTGNTGPLLPTNHSNFLQTVSRLVSSRDVRRRTNVEDGGRLLHVTDPDPTIKPKTFPKPPILETLLYIHIVTFIVILLFTWIDTLPGIGRGLLPADLYRTIKYGLMCHVKGSSSCTNVSGHAWTFLCAYVMFAISIVNFLSMCESAVFSVAATTVSLPLSGIWWSIYKMDVGINGGWITLSPGVTGELICALIGLPVVLLGLGLLTKSHFKETLPPYQILQSTNNIQSDSFCR
ncbi:uncharacterized protein LOC127282886 [Leptopilina boulardi]|uniref:uncharacterized protein LOC127282886 n=1 Tax=Leptopilina boulardi TaxID=63433 RepID=UPI0021F5E7E3|nr:uncharacterized protein LOC127282886 [Leptopilina boulardi]